MLGACREWRRAMEVVNWVHHREHFAHCRNRCNLVLSYVLSFYLFTVHISSLAYLVFRATFDACLLILVQDGFDRETSG